MIVSGFPCNSPPPVVIPFTISRLLPLPWARSFYSPRAMPPKRLFFSSHFLFVLFPFLFCTNYSSAQPQPPSDSLILLNFRSKLQNASALAQWDPSTDPCNPIWPGIICDKDRVWGLKLENMGLTGIIDIDALSQLDSLRTVSVTGNNFQGPIPLFSRLGALKAVYLSDNDFSGVIPEQAFAGMSSLKKLYLEGNRLSGMIPTSLSTLPRLMELRLDGNEFTGGIPNLNPDKFKVFNVSQNKLAGEIPPPLRRFDASSFSGNQGLCGPPLQPCPTNNQKKSNAATNIVGVLIAVAVVALIVVLLLLVRRKKSSPVPHQAAAKPKPATAAAAAQSRQKSAGVDVEQGRASTSSAAASVANKPQQNVKLTFLRDDVDKFDMTDLLKSSAEVLGSGSFGSTYKTALSQGRVMVVKRFKYMNNLSKEEFSEHMRRLGALRHPNVLPIVAFYYRKEEKLMVSEYVTNFSLAVQLHGNQSRGRPSPDWPSRLKIIKGIAAGLQYLYTALPSVVAPHGHLKASNVLLDANFKPFLADYGLVPIVNQEHAPMHLISYKSPEYKDSQRISRKSDVWSFGILILETLTGRVPANFLQKSSGSDVDLPTWVESVIRSSDDANAAEALFDKEMEGMAKGRGEMMKLVKIGMECCNMDMNQRPEIKEVVEKIEKIKEKD